MSEISSAPTGAQEIGKIFSYGSTNEHVRVIVNTETNVNSVTVNEECLVVPGLPGAAEDTQILSALVDASSTLRNRNTASYGLIYSGLAANAVGLISVYAGVFAELKTRKAGNGLTSQESLEFWHDVLNITPTVTFLGFLAGTLSVGAGLYKERANKRDKNAKLEKIVSALHTHVNI